jgi:hypothetical protein
MRDLRVSAPFSGRAIEFELTSLFLKSLEFKDDLDFEEDSEVLKT